MNDEEAKHREELAQLMVVEDDIKQRKEAILQKLGTPSASGMGDRLRVENEEATLFDRLTPAEKVDLYTNRHEEWERLLRAKEAAGMRQLLRK